MSGPSEEQLRSWYRDERVRAARSAQIIERELATNETAKAILDHANRQREEALERLANAKPWDSDAIFRAQWDFHVAKGILVAVKYAIERGELAYQDLEIEAADD